MVKSLHLGRDAVYIVEPEANIYIYIVMILNLLNFRTAKFS